MTKKWEAWQGPATSSARRSEIARPEGELRALWYFDRGPRGPVIGPMMPRRMWELAVL